MEARMNATTEIKIGDHVRHWSQEKPREVIAVRNMPYQEGRGRPGFALDTDILGNPIFVDPCDYFLSERKPCEA
jgi:hypothetical protein